MFSFCRVPVSAAVTCSRRATFSSPHAEQLGSGRCRAGAPAPPPPGPGPRAAAAGPARSPVPQPAAAAPAGAPGPLHRASSSVPTGPGSADPAVRRYRPAGRVLVSAPHPLIHPDGQLGSRQCHRTPDRGECWGLERRLTSSDWPSLHWSACHPPRPVPVPTPGGDPPGS